MDHMSAEKWAPIAGYEGHYEVSDHGNVRSLDRVVKTSRGTRRVQGKTLSKRPDTHGYYRVRLCLGGRKADPLIHRLVIETFVGPPGEGQECCHTNGNNTDNRVENLRWATHRENILDIARYGTYPEKKKTHCPQGHPYDKVNTKIIPSRPNARYCRACHRERYLTGKAEP